MENKIIVLGKNNIILQDINNTQIEIIQNNKKGVEHLIKIGVKTKNEERINNANEVSGIYCFDTGRIIDLLVQTYNNVTFPTFIMKYFLEYRNQVVNLPNQYTGLVQLCFEADKLAKIIDSVKDDKPGAFNYFVK